jgi:hypothetical protein
MVCFSAIGLSEGLYPYLYETRSQTADLHHMACFGTLHRCRQQVKQN